MAQFRPSKKVKLIHLYREDQLENSAEFKNPDSEKITHLRIGVIGHHSQGDNFLYSHSASAELESISIEETIEYIMKLLKANPSQFLVISLQACEAALPTYGMFYSQSFAGKLQQGIYKKCHESKITTSICVQARTNNFSSKFNLFYFKKTSLPQNMDKTTAKLRFITQNDSQYLQDAYNSKIIGKSEEFYPEKDLQNSRFFVKK